MKHTDRKPAKRRAAGVVAVIAASAFVTLLGEAAGTQAEVDPGAGLRSVVFDYERNEVIVDGQRKAPVYPMANENGRIYVAARQIAEVFGYEAAWDPKSFDAVLRSDSTSIHVNSGARQAWVNEIPVPYEGLGLLRDGRLLLSIRAIADVMGLHVHYDPSTRQAIVADAAYPYVSAFQEAASRKVGIDFSRYGQYAVVPAAETRDASRTLLFSDSPETFRDYGLLYRDAVDGKARVYLTHVNGMPSKEAVVALVGTNRTDRPVTLTLTRQAFSDRSKDYATQGRQALSRWYGASAASERNETLLAPGESTVLYVTDALRSMEGAHALFDLASDGEVTYETIAAPAGTKAEVAAFREEARPLARDIHDRGTFPVADIALRADGRAWKDGEPARLKIGVSGSLSGHWTEGEDALTGEPAMNFGNYGVFYHLTVDRPGEAVFVLVPLRGLYKGSVSFNGELVETDALSVGEGYVIGRTNGAEEEAKLVLSAASGSYMPFEILVFPL